MNGARDSGSTTCTREDASFGAAALRKDVGSTRVNRIFSLQPGHFGMSDSVDDFPSLDGVSYKYLTFWERIHLAPGR
jgi:hypothetical protein